MDEWMNVMSEWHVISQWHVVVPKIFLEKCSIMQNEEKTKKKENEKKTRMNITENDQKYKWNMIEKWPER